jgi:sulfite reductase alpha subunit-like flavoprotein
LKVNDTTNKIPIWIKKGSFKYNSNDPIIYIGPGTGIAPFRSIINERIFSNSQSANNYLYFGCRNKQMDFFFEDEWKTICKSGKLSLRVAFSRDTPDKVYVQDILMEYYKLVYDLMINKNAIVMIAGSSNRMPSDVIAFLQKIYIKSKKELELFNSTEEDEEELENEAKDWIKYLDKSKRLQLETWS